MTGKDNQVHSIHVEAEGLFDAAYQGIREWSMLWWFSGDALIDVKADADHWRVRARRVAAWYSEQFHKRSNLRSRKNS